MHPIDAIKVFEGGFDRRRSMVNLVRRKYRQTPGFAAEETKDMVNQGDSIIIS